MPIENFFAYAILRAALFSAASAGSLAIIFQFCYLFVRRLARSTKRNKRKVVSGSRVTLPENFAYKPELSFNPLARVTLAVGLPYLLVNRAIVTLKYKAA